MRGPATIYEGKLFRQTVDAHLLALDMKTGKEIWKQKYADWKEGYKGVIAPLIANGVLISGMAGGDSTTRGFVEAYDPQTGKQLWRRYTIPAPGEPGSETWPNQTKPDAWKYGGGATWQYASYDPQLDLVYIGTGNAEPYNPTFRDGADCLYTASTLALRPKTGEMVWYYQSVPNDSFDFDATAESLLAELRVDGQARKVLINAHKNGFLYVLDRSNGKPIEPLTGKVAWQVPMMEVASSAGMLATDGGLLFTSLLTGEVIALDQDSGKTLWQFKTGSSVNAPPITYTHKGRQYVTVLSGR